jgi:hypothetical protein
VSLTKRIEGAVSSLFVLRKYFIDKALTRAIKERDKNAKILL